MKKLIVIVFVVFTVFLAFQNTSDARVIKFSTLLGNPELAADFNPVEDHILFRHNAEESFPLNFKQKDDGIVFKLDNGEGNRPRYTVLGEVRINACQNQKVGFTRLPNVRGTLVDLNCGQ